MTVSRLPDTPHDQHGRALGDQPARPRPARRLSGWQRVGLIVSVLWVVGCAVHFTIDGFTRLSAANCQVYPHHGYGSEYRCYEALGAVRLEYFLLSAVFVLVGLGVLWSGGWVGLKLSRFSIASGRALYRWVAEGFRDGR